MSEANPAAPVVAPSSLAEASKVQNGTGTVRVAVSSSDQSLLPTLPPPPASAMSVSVSVPLKKPAIGMKRAVQPTSVAAKSSLVSPAPPPPSVPPIPPATATANVQSTRSTSKGIAHGNSLASMTRTNQPDQSALKDLPIERAPTLSAVERPSVALDTLPVHIPIVDPIVRYCELTPYVVVPPVREVPPPAVAMALRKQRNREHHVKPFFQSFSNRFLWQPSPSSNFEDTVPLQKEVWRGAHWEHVDVHRYIARRLCGNPPPIE